MNTTKHNQYETQEWNSDEVKGWWAKLYVGGDLRESEMVCRKACFPKGMCVTIEPVKYIFAGGTEDGVCVGLIQYVPFPEDEADLLEKLTTLGRQIAEANHQWSFSIITPYKSIFHSRRKR